MKVPPSRWPEAALTLARTFGLRGARLRVSHEARRALGRFRLAPRFPLSAATGEPLLCFRVDAARLTAATDGAVAVERGDRVVAGEHQAYRWDWRPLPADAAGWHRHPLSGRGHPADAPWWTIPHLDAAVGDVKDLWEPARFGWAYDLVRAWLVTGDGRYAEAFHRTFAGWRAANPPLRGVQWSCGQETAIRAAALLYAEANLPSSDDQRKALADTLAASGERIADAIGYAVSQRNNHALSEAAGLVLLGARLDGVHREAGRWLRDGAGWLERLVPEQLAADGWYVQHSFTYLRLALEQCILAQRVLRSRGGGLSERAAERLRAGVGLLLAVVDGPTGEVPNHGASDGAFIHPVTLGGYRDFRPALTAACATFGMPLPADVAADGETLAWLGEAPPPAAPARGDGVWTGRSGWAVVRAGGVVAFMRAGGYTARPAHLDPLHLDVRVDGREVVVDPGTFAYNGPPPWRNGLVSAAVHNGPLVDDAEPGVRGPRFLWYLWPSAALRHAAHEGGEWVLRAEVPGRARREVRVGAAGVRVRDEALAPGACSLSVAWTLHPRTDPAWVRVRGESRVEAAREGAVAGWFSPLYGCRLASRRLVARRGRPEPLLIETEIARPRAEPQQAAAAAGASAHAIEG
jgi:hypothetical protein